MSAASATSIRAPRVRRKPGPPPRPSRNDLLAMQRITAMVSDATAVRITDMHSHRRTSHVAHARQLAWYMMRESLPSVSYPQLGAFFGRDHTTAIHGVQVIRKRMETKTLLLQPMLKRCRQAAEPEEKYFRVGDLPASGPMTGILA